MAEHFCAAEPRSEPETSGSRYRDSVARATRGRAQTDTEPLSGVCATLCGREPSFAARRGAGFFAVAREHSHSIVDCHGHGWPGAADRVCECGQPVACTRRRAGAGNLRALRIGRAAGKNSATARSGRSNAWPGRGRARVTARTPSIRAVSADDVYGFWPAVALFGDSRLADFAVQFWHRVAR